MRRPSRIRKCSRGLGKSACRFIAASTRTRNCWSMNASFIFRRRDTRTLLSRSHSLLMAARFARTRRCLVRWLFRTMMTGICAIAIVSLTMGTWAGAQTPAPSARTSTVPRTPDGQPDLQGMYTRNGIVGLEAQPPVNPIDPSDRNPLSVSNRGDGLGPYPGIFGEGGRLLRGGQGRQQRRTGIVDPPDKNLPWRPEEDAKRR